MKIYTLRIVYSELNNEIHEIEEIVEDVDMHYRVGEMDLEDLVQEEELWDKLRESSTEVAIT